MSSRTHNIQSSTIKAYVTGHNAVLQWCVYALVAVIIVACSSDESDISTGQSNFDISLSIEPYFIDAAGNRIELSDIEIPSTNDAKLTITSVSTGESHTWPTFNDFDNRESFQAGEYNLSAVVDMGNGLELGAEANVTTMAGARVPIDLVLTPLRAMVNIATSSNASGYSVISTGVHVTGTGRFIEGSSVFCPPAPCKAYVRLRDVSGREVTALFERAFNAEAAHSYDIVVSVNDNNIGLIIDGIDYGTINVDASLFDSSVPQIVPVGYDPSTAVSATEGLTLTEPVAMNLTSGTPIKHVYISIDSPIISLITHTGSEAEVDLMNLTPEQAEQYAKSSIVFAISEDRRTASLTFTKTIEELASLTSTRSIFTVTAVDNIGRMAEPAHLTVDTHTIGFNVVSVRPLVSGENTCAVTLKPTIAGVEESDMRFYTMSDSTRIDCPIKDSATNDDGTIDVVFSIPHPQKTTTVFFEYMGLIRTKFNVPTVMPPFTVIADAYATYVRLIINAENKETVSRLTSQLLFYNGDSRCSILERDPERGLVIVNGLKPGTRYRINPCITIGEPLGTVGFTTEKALAVPDGDFEDVKLSSIKYSGLPCGGRYAVTPFEIANRQNYVDIDIPWSKKYWASINAKTFCNAAAHKNTWYMQPSTEVVFDSKSGSKAMKITSVGWDLAGEAIADYIPTSATPVPSYSLVIPKVSHRSAGRLFLGKYTFHAMSMTEIYESGIPFTSRPTALNGFYKYTADQTVTTDRGGVVIRLISRARGEDTVIAEGRAEFSAVPDYTAFNVPLVYVHNDIRPTHLEIMFVSSTLEGEDNAPVTALADRGAMTGSTLWVDNLSFAY